MVKLYNSWADNVLLICTVLLCRLNVFLLLNAVLKARVLLIANGTPGSLAFTANYINQYATVLVNHFSSALRYLIRRNSTSGKTCIRLAPWESSNLQDPY